MICLQYVSNILIILDPPSLLIQSGNMSVVEGNRFELLCNGISFPIFNVTWYKNNELFTSAASIYTDWTSNNRSVTLTVTSANVTDEGFYNCVLTNAFGSLTSKAIWIDIQCKNDDISYVILVFTIQI